MLLQPGFELRDALVGRDHPELHQVKLARLGKVARHLRAGDAQALGDLALVVILLVVRPGDLDQQINFLSFTHALPVGFMLAPECNYLHTNNYINTIAENLEKSTGILYFPQLTWKLSLETLSSLAAILLSTRT